MLIITTTIEIKILKYYITNWAMGDSLTCHKDMGQNLL
jgi:hypothetical protein